MNQIDRLVSPKLSIYGLAVITSVFFNNDSKYYLEQQLYDVIILLLNYIEGIQRSDGNFDLLSVNYYFAPDTAFMAQRLAIAYRITEKYGKGEKSEIIKDRLIKIIKKAGYGIAEGGGFIPQINAG